MASPESEKKSPIDRMRRGLYSQKMTPKSDVRHDVHLTTAPVAPDWQHEEKKEEEVAMPSPRKTYKKIFWFSLGLFIIALGVAAYSFFGGGVFVSSDNVDMTVSSPANIAGGSETDFTVNVENKNKTDIELVDLIAEFPDGTKETTDLTQDAGRQQVSLGTISSGQVAQGNFSAVFFGSQGESQTVKFTVEYHTADSNAVFYKEKDVPITIASSPVSLSIGGLDSVNAGEPTTLTFTVSSNSTNITRNLALALSYPFGWTTLSSSPSPSSGDSLWEIGDLAPGATTTITVSGKIDGEDGDERTVSANLGVENAQGAIATTMVSEQKTISIEKPFLATTLSLDGNTSGDYAVPLGKNITGVISWENTGSDRISNGSITVALSGAAFDPSSVTTDDGVYDSRTDTITWDGGRDSDLSLISPGQSGELHFNFSTLSNVSNTANASVNLDVAASGNRIDQANVTQAISSESTRTVKIVSNLSLSAGAFRTSSVMNNTGPLPPKVNQTTDYTIVWTAANTSNTVSGAKVSALLPANVTYTGISAPADGSVSYSSSTGDIVWSIGTLNPGQTKEIDFQVALAPNAAEVGQELTLVQGIIVSGTDDFAGIGIQSGTPDLTTLISNDPAYVAGDEAVSN